MISSKHALRQLLSAFLGDSPPPKPRRMRQVIPMLDGLEDRVALSHLAAVHHHHHAHHVASAQTSTSETSATTSGTTSSTTVSSASDSSGSGYGTTSSSSSTLGTARQTLRNDIQTVELASSTTIGQLAAIRSAFQTLESDGLEASSYSALSSFEDSLVKSFASGTTLTDNATLLAQFETLYTSSPTAQETTDLTTAYNALAAAVTSSNITSADLTTIDADQAAVLAALGSSSTATFPYFTLVAGRAGGGEGGGEGGGCH
jgi:papilin